MSPAKAEPPAALKSQWRREWKLVSGRLIRNVEGGQDERRLAYESTEPVLIMNYEALLRDIDLVLAAGFDAVILDEAQRIKNYASQTAQQVKRLRPPFRLILTGTPMENRIQEFASLMDWIDSDVMGPYWRLDAATKLGDRGGDGPRGVRGLRLIREQTAPYFLRRLRRDVLKQLPSRCDTSCLVEVSEEQLSVHGELAILVRRLMKISEHRPLTPDEHLRLMSYLTRAESAARSYSLYQS